MDREREESFSFLEAITIFADNDLSQCVRAHSRKYNSSVVE